MKMRPFELALVLIFGLLGLLAIALLAGYRPGPDDPEAGFGGPVVVWGTTDSGAFARTMDPYVTANEAYKAISYIQKDKNTIESELLNALAEGRGPDLLFLPHEDLVSYRSKLTPLPYENFPLRDYKNLYIDGAEIFALKDGIYAYPVAVDPLVMYWNRDILSSKNIIAAPKTWEEVVNKIVPTTVQRDYNRTISLSPIAFGEYRNVQHAFDVMSLLMIQGGSALVTEKDAGQYQIALNQSVTPVTRPPLEGALLFYSQFSNPTSEFYSWNASLPRDEDVFTANDLVLYFGKGSIARELIARNPNINIDMAEVPQGTDLRRTYGTFYGFSILKNARNKQGAYLALQLLGSQNFAAKLATELNMAPVHRAALQAGSDDVYGRIIYSAAVSARGWLNPDRERVDTIFTQMVEEVRQGTSLPSMATGDALQRLEQEY